MFETLDIARLKFILTMDCNFRCDYCFEGGKSKLNLDVDEAVRLGKRVIEESPQSEIKVLYFGGEPLLRFKDMRTITQLLRLHADKYDKKMVFTTITNGSIMSKEIADHFSKYKYFVSVSCDGIKDAHNIHRGFVGGVKNSHAKVESTLRLLNRCTHDLCASMVVTRQNCKYLAESFLWLAKDYGVRNFAISPVLDQAEYSPFPDGYLDQLIQISDIARSIGGRFVINPPLDTGWDMNANTRKMTLTANSVNVELSPLGLTIIPEASVVTHIDFDLNSTHKKTPADHELRLQIIKAETLAHEYYRSH